MSRLHSGAWYGERTMAIEVPAGRDVAGHWPNTPALGDLGDLMTVETASGRPTKRT